MDNTIIFHYRTIGLGAMAGKLNRVNISSGALATTHNRMNNSMKGLALRFVGYNLILGQVMGAQQKLAQFVMDSVKSYREFETRLAEISTILQDDVTQMAKFEMGIENLSLTYGKSTSDISKGLYDILSAAFSTRDAMNLLNTSIKASIAGLTDVRTAVKVFTTVLNSYGLSVEQATRVSDVLFQAVVRGKFQFAELEQALGYVVPIAAQAGIGIEELTAALSTATRHGLHLDMTARGLALAIQGIVNPSAQAEKAAVKYGIEMNGLSLRVLGLKGWFDELRIASDKYGKGVIGELIPNMRSVRVAMVLAGEEGAKGFADDLKYLENITGRTEEALAKMMETTSFVATQLEQALEAVKREVGGSWSSSLNEAQKVVLGLASAFGVVGSVIHDFFSFSEDGFANMSRHWDNYIGKIEKLIGVVPGVLKGYEDLDKYGKALAYIKASQESGKISEDIYESLAAGSTIEELEALDKELQKHLTIMELTGDGYNDVKGAVDDFQTELAGLETLLGEIDIDVDKIGKKLFSPQQYGTQGKTIEGSLYLEQAQIAASKAQADAQHDIKLGLVDSTYQWVTNNEAVEKAVKIVREHAETQEEDKKATNLMSVALKALQIDMLEIQLHGMMSRRGLSRSEQRQMKRVQIEQAKLRLKNMKSQKVETETTVTAYQTAQDAIDEFLRKVEEESYQLKYSYNQQEKDIADLISYEHKNLLKRGGYWSKTEQEIVDGNTLFYQNLLAIAENPALKTAWEMQFDMSIEEKMAEVLARIDAAVKGEARPSYVSPISNATQLDYMIQSSPSFQQILSRIPERVRDIFAGRGIPGFASGIDYVPYDQMAMIHQGERIIPASENNSNSYGGNTVNISLNAVINNKMDINEVTKLMGKAMQSELMDNRTGKSKYRSR